MSDEQYKPEKAYSTSEISELVGIAEPTVRKYAQALERSGYRFLKDDFGTRTYIEKDAIAIREFKEVRTKSKMPVENVAVMIAAKYRNIGAIQPISPANTAPEKTLIQRYDVLSPKELTELIDGIVAGRVRAEVAAVKDALLERMDERDTVIRKLVEALDAQQAIATESEENANKRIQQAIDDAMNRHNERMNDEVERRATELAAIMRELLATKQEAAAAREAIEKQRGRSIWAKLFGN